MTRGLRILFFTILLAAITIVPVGAQAGDLPAMDEPKSGEALQGLVTINGSNSIAGFVSSEISFSYSGDATETWFLIATTNTPIQDGTLTTWDTTSITDGDYRLRLRVFLENGSFQDVYVNDLRVRNYTPIETPTPGPTAIRPTLVPTITLTPTRFPTPTQMPTNQAILTPLDVSFSIGYGGIIAVILLALMGIYLALKRK